jgi:hypothetical protein
VLTKIQKGAVLLSTKTDYQLTKTGDFVITNYNSAKLFSSFFPGVAGKNGIPMWVFYVNRGQGICSMGVEGKHHPIMEFLPANRAYQLVSSQGFRTFVKFPERTDIPFYEPFQNHLRDADIERTQQMRITPEALTLVEENKALGLQFTVEYLTVPNDTYAGLIRTLTIKNIGTTPLELEVMDGLPLIIPYGLDNNGLKFMRRLFEAFVEVVNYDQGVPFFKGKVKPADRPDVVRIKKGNFYMGFTRDGTLVPTVVDPVKIFGSHSDYSYPEKFLTDSRAQMLMGQIFENRLPCAMGLFTASIPAGETYTYTSVIGHAGSVDELNSLVPQISNQTYVATKKAENKQVISRLTQNNFLCSANSVLDAYTQQNFLDNTLRGGMPVTLKGKKHASCLHLYSRKHGDLERDYNDYRLTPTPYSQGNGNYRDVNQNRRCDLFFNPDVHDANVEHFSNLIQLDGFNPLVIKEIRYFAEDAQKRDTLLAEYLDADAIEKVIDYIKQPFTPGELMLFMKDQGIDTGFNTDLFMGDLLGICKTHHETGYGEGYWTDHWTYNLDLMENFLAVYPDKKQELLFTTQNYTFYDNPHVVAPRADKYVLWDGKPMQLNGVVLDEEKEALITSRCSEPNKVRTNFGHGEVYVTTLFVKLLSLMVNKLASLDAGGVGIEMETDKPNWYDALNGLPGLIGSSISETVEVKRHLEFMLQALAEFKPKTIVLFSELHSFMQQLQTLLDAQLSVYDFWDQSATIKEAYRTETRLGISGEEIPVEANTIITFLTAGLAKINQAIDRAWDVETDIIATYFVHDVTEYEIIKTTNATGKEITKRNKRGFPCFRALAFRQRALPPFLEGPVHYLRSKPQASKALRLAQSIRHSGLFDEKLKMYKVNASLHDEPMEIGRARTFSPGWFENESIWLHMEYKYMLELLRNQLYHDFFQDFKQVFIPYMDPAVYGRSILENSSFIVSSGNPDPSIHGNGFVARLSGATAEFISIMMHMAVGPTPFSVDHKGQLQLSFAPVLPGWLFTQQQCTRQLYINGTQQDVHFAPHTLSYMFLGEVLVTYHNRLHKNTFGSDAVKPTLWKLTYRDGSSVTLEGETLSGSIAEQVRNRDVSRIEIELS